MENNSITPTAVALGGTLGALGGSTVGVVMVAESGAVAGLSASGITSGLAALGGGPDGWKWKTYGCGSIPGAPNQA